MNRFSLQERLGNGSYSDVFKARNIQTGQSCALKIMKQPYESNKACQDMELYTLKKFGMTPTVITLKESFVDEGYLILVFELLDNNLIDYYKMLRNVESRELTSDEIKSVLYQVCLALQSMHSQGYAHRDIKPQNVLIRRFDSTIQAKLTDFGLTKKLDKKKNTNYVATRWYRSPELLLNMRYDLSVDVFAFGCLMLELYLGFEPFPGNDTIDQLNKIFSILGSPDQQSWPEGMKILKEKGIKFASYPTIDLSTCVLGLCQQALELINNTLVNNPNKRLNILEILTHPYFKGVNSLVPKRVVDYVKKYPNLSGAMRYSHQQQSVLTSWNFPNIQTPVVQAIPTIPLDRLHRSSSTVRGDVLTGIKSSDKSTDQNYSKPYQTQRAMQIAQQIQASSLQHMTYSQIPPQNINTAQYQHLFHTQPIQSHTSSTTSVNYPIEASHARLPIHHAANINRYIHPQRYQPSPPAPSRKSPSTYVTINYCNKQNNLSPSNNKIVYTNTSPSPTGRQNKNHAINRQPNPVFKLHYNQTVQKPPTPPKAPPPAQRHIQSRTVYHHQSPSTLSYSPSCRIVQRSPPAQHRTNAYQYTAKPVHLPQAQKINPNINTKLIIGTTQRAPVHSISSVPTTGGNMVGSGFTNLHLRKRQAEDYWEDYRPRQKGCCQVVCDYLTGSQQTELEYTIGRERSYMYGRSGPNYESNNCCKNPCINNDNQADSVYSQS